ncbi:MAG: 2-oxoacid:acceptor oxidoreductase subunit alpha [Bacteroidetes bacterium]|nr:2-oxoacid:acceptor oxidoreductase subunit alpha [Bacteroidota bacterium]
MATQEQKQSVVILFAGDSGDGIQLTGTQFTTAAALHGNDISTFPNFPAEIRAPQGTLAGVSGFQVHFGSVAIHSPGDACDVLVVMNAAALKANLRQLREGGTIIANTDGFDPKNLKLAKFPDGVNPLRDGSLDRYRVIEIDVTKLTRTALAGSGMGTKETDRSKNMFVLGFVCWMYNRSLDSINDFLREQFRKRPELVEANTKVLTAGYHYGDTIEQPMTRYEVKAATLETGTYRSITGNAGIALGLIAAAKKSGLTLFYGTYPITPASDILHELSKHKNFGVKTYQAEDEIAGITSAIGASFGGNLGVTASSGPGIALKTEAIGLAAMLELPLVIINVQRGGPSTGLPTKTEQADLLQALYGRNGECPVPVIASSTPSDCFEVAYEATRIAIEHMTPVFMLSDGYIANGAEPWKFPKADDLKPIEVRFAKNELAPGEKFMPYKRNEKLVRPWAIPGTPGLEHRVGGIEKEKDTGNISYDPENHQYMVKMRAERIARIADYIPAQQLDSGPEKGKVLVLGWGSTYGSVKTALNDLRSEGVDAAHAHVRYLFPFPKNLGEMIARYDHVLVPEINNGQLIKLIRDEFQVNATPLNKIKGVPFTSSEICEAVKNLYNK